jgi:GT2 family glycosyltransferase
LADVWPRAAQEVADTPVLAGDIFNAMFFGNLVHTSTVMLRRERLVRTGLFDPLLRFSGEDYEFHFRTASHGPVALLDAAAIRYRIGALDQLSQPEWMVHVARNNLTTVLRWLDRGGDRIKLSGAVMRRRLADCYAWAGETELDRGENDQAARHFWRSIRYHPSARAAGRLALCALPPPIYRSARRVGKTVRRAMRSL